VTGWLDDKSQKQWGRPVDVKLANEGSVLISDDYSGNDLSVSATRRHVDGTCQFCQRGRENLCRDSRYTGYDADGGYAEYAVVPEDFAYELPEGLDDEHVSPLLCGGLIGYRALQRAAMPEKGRLLLVGLGSSAHIVIQIALHRGHEVFVVTRGENHIRQARELGAAWRAPISETYPARAMGRCSSRRPASSSLRHWRHSIAAGLAPSPAFISVTCRASTTAGIFTRK
jgi:propanol-preferring alcohol dehydrogenase